MKPSFFRCILFLSLSVIALGETASFTPKTIPQDPAREAALDALLSERESEDAFQKALVEARKAGISEQTMLEARFLYAVDTQNDAALVTILPEIASQIDHFNPQESTICDRKEDWLAIHQYVTAISRHLENDPAGFKKHLTEAFWSSPTQAATLAPHIERIRHDETIRKIQLNLDLSLASLSGENTLKIKDLMANRKMLLLHLWSPEDERSKPSLTDFAPTAKFLEEHGLTVISLIPGEPLPSLDTARALTLPLGSPPPGYWLIDSTIDSLFKALQVSRAPHFALISSEGKILFSGDPRDEKFWATLKQIDATLTRPSLLAPSQ